ncbi:LacI family transcriptional regulator [Paenibacillus sp. P25]|nr:LacI family transcriptional regulator [Paenibacillus sp. P25]
MTVSIKDVARAAGVSTASVSRVLSGKPGVGADTAERIRKVIEEMDYRPNLGARGLVKRTTGNIAVVVPRGSFILNNPFFSTVLEGIAKGIDQTDYNMLMSFTSAQQKRPLETQAVDGVILFSPRHEELSLEWLQSIGLPIVVVGSYLEESPSPACVPTMRTESGKRSARFMSWGIETLG